MRNVVYFTVMATAGALLCVAASAEVFNIPGGDLESALNAYTSQTGVDLIVSDDAIKGIRSKGVKGNLSADDALARILTGTGFIVQRHTGGTIAVVRGDRAANDPSVLKEAATPIPNVSNAALETVTVTSSKIGGDVQNIPISITALSQEQLTATQTAGGPDLIKQVPNMTFTKTNFSGYSIQLRGIGTQAISVTTDPAVAVAFNDIPFIRNHFFEQEFYDVAQVEVLRGPQGTLYGRNATAGVVNLASAKPTDQFEAMASLEIGNYGERRPEGMINIPVVDDRLDIRIAGEWTKRQGYSFNTLTDNRIDGRDLWSGRVTIGLKPIENVQMYLIWEHFSEDDDRMRSSKQLCKTDPGPTEIGGHVVVYGGYQGDGNYLTQGCLPASPYSPESYEVPNAFSLGYIAALSASDYSANNGSIDVYASTKQSRNLRVIESALNPTYQTKNDIVELNADYVVTPALTFTSQTGFNHDFLWGTEDYNRFNTQPGVFAPSHCCSSPDQIAPSQGDNRSQVSSAGVFCDPQLGCSDRIVAEDLSTEHAWQLSQEFRLTSNLTGPLNFSVGGNYLHYETEESYYVFINAVTLFMSGPTSAYNSFGPYYRWVPGVSDNHQCFNGLRYGDPAVPAGNGLQGCGYIDPNPITHLDNEGHNYFLSQNPYLLDSYAGFGEAYYNVLSDLKLTAGLRWTEDRKHFTQIPSWIAAEGYGYPVAGVVNQQWDELTGRFNTTWTPKLDFTDQTLIYGSYAHGYKAGGANPPGAILLDHSVLPIHPLTFKPEFIDAFELGTKNTLLDGSLTVNGDVFYYNYESYQISEIVDRTAINLNFDAHVKGAEVEGTWEPLPGLKFNFAGGWEDTALAQGSKAVDLIDRTAGNPNWIVVKPNITQASNCILPLSVLEAAETGLGDTVISSLCEVAYSFHIDPITGLPYVPNPTVRCPGATSNLDGSCNPASGPATLPLNIPGYAGFDPNAAPNGGAGIDKNLGGHQLPNAPPYTVSFGAQYTLPLSPDWAGTLRGDFYWQDSFWARIFNDNPYDRIHGYTNLNLTLIFTNQNGWQVMLFDKNVFDTTAITGTFLNSDDTGLTTNVFLTDPKLIGVRVTKNW